MVVDIVLLHLLVLCANMNQKTQIKYVQDLLDSQGEVSRNFCLQNYITRLSSIIFQLKKEGYGFVTQSRANIKPDGTKGKDFIYQVVTYPLN